METLSTLYFIALEGIDNASKTAVAREIKKSIFNHKRIF